MENQLSQIMKQGPVNYAGNLYPKLYPSNAIECVAKYLKSFCGNNVVVPMPKQELRSVPHLGKDFVYAGPDHPLPIPSQKAGPGRTKNKIMNLEINAKKVVYRAWLTAVAAQRQKIFRQHPCQSKWIIVHQKRSPQLSTKMYKKKKPDKKGLYIKNYKLKEKLTSIVEENELITENNDDGLTSVDNGISAISQILNNLMQITEEENVLDNEEIDQNSEERGPNNEENRNVALEIIDLQGAWCHPKGTQETCK